MSWKLFFFPISVICGGTYNATWTPQNILSPTASNPDVPFSTCTWVFEAPLHQQVEITVWTLQLQSLDCHQNYLEFQDTPEVIITVWMAFTSTDLFTSTCKILEVWKMKSIVNIFPSLMCFSAIHKPSI